MVQDLIKTVLGAGTAVVGISLLGKVIDKVDGQPRKKRRKAKPMFDFGFDF